jgi:hypothetical protein
MIKAFVRPDVKKMEHSTTNNKKRTYAHFSPFKGKNRMD